MRNVPGGMQSFLKQAQQMQNKMAKVQEALAEKTVEATSGGGAVKVIITGQQALSQITISAEAAGDVEMLQDLVMTAMNEGIRKSKQMAEEEMNKVTGGMSIPGLF
jgi:DNA-binding YbaB/EbfC family protein